MLAGRLSRLIKSIACFYYDVPQASAKVKIAILTFEGGPFIKTFDVPPDFGGLRCLRWTPDSRAMIYSNFHFESKIMDAAAARRSPKGMG
jgi:hypothetical protein